MYPQIFGRHKLDSASTANDDVMCGDGDEGIESSSEEPEPSKPEGDDDGSDSSKTSDSFERVDPTKDSSPISHSSPISKERESNRTSPSSALSGTDKSSPSSSSPCHTSDSYEKVELAAASEHGSDVEILTKPPCFSCLTMQNMIH